VNTNNGRQARLSKQTPAPVWGKLGVEEVLPGAWNYTPSADAVIDLAQSRRAGGRAAHNAAVIAAWNAAGRPSFDAAPDPAAKTIVAEVRYFSQKSLVDDDSVYRVHHRVRGPGFDPSKLLDRLADALRLLADKQRREMGRVSFWDRVKEDEAHQALSQEDDQLSQTSHRDSRRSVRPIWNKDELERLRGNLRAETKGDPEAFVRRFTAGAIAKRVILPNQVDAAHRLLDSICSPEDDEFMRVSTGKVLKGRAEEWSDNVASTVHLNMVAGRMVEEGHKHTAPRVRRAPPGVNVVVDRDGSIVIGLRKRERSKKKWGKPLQEKIGPAGPWRDTTVLEALADHAVQWTLPSWLEPEPDCEPFALRDLLTVDLPMAA
jgi:hypothetical protein